MQHILIKHLKVVVEATVSAVTRLGMFIGEKVQQLSMTKANAAQWAMLSTIVCWDKSLQFYIALIITGDVWPLFPIQLTSK